MRRITDTHVLMNRRAQRASASGLGLSRLRHGADSGKELRQRSDEDPGTMG